jgi:hypothetical protein
MLGAVPRLVLTLTFGQPEAAPAAPVSNAAVLLARCDQSVAQGERVLAHACFEELRLRYPGTPEAHDAERALALMQLMGTAPSATPPPATTPAPPADARNFYVVEPYSLKTKERLRLTTWEKLDFGISAFIYGLSTGASVAGAAESDSGSILAPMVVGALVYTGLSVLYVNTDGVDRGDLPLTLAITSYIPLTAGLVALAAETDSPRAAAGLVAGSAVASLPLAYWAAATHTLDPGDTQLVRDSGFWGAILGVTGALSTENPKGRTVGVAGLAGLYGGLGLGLLAASHSDVSLERVRVTTWGGYGGAILGALLAAAGNDDAPSVFRNVGLGSALGLLVTFISSSAIDEAPANAHFDERPRSSVRYLEPALLPVVARDGRTQARPGVNLLRGRF